MNRSRLRPLLAAAALLTSGCMVAAHPAAPAVMPPGQAASIAAQYARSRGLFIDYTLSTRLDRRGRWHVELGGAGGRDHALVVLDGWSGAILNARLRGPRGAFASPPPPYQAPGAPYQGPPAQAPAPPPGGPPGQGAPPPPPPDSPPAAPGESPGPTPPPPPG